MTNDNAAARLAGAGAGALPRTPAGKAKLSALRDRRAAVS